LLVLDSTGVSRLAERTIRTVTLVRSFRSMELWPPVVPTVVLVESLRGHAGHDANTNRALKAWILQTRLPERLARRAAELRRHAGRGSAVDAIVVALAEPGGTVLTSDEGDIKALATHAHGVSVEVI
jgi:hypothetical protein